MTAALFVSGNTFDGGAHGDRSAERNRAPAGDEPQRLLSMNGQGSTSQAEM